MKILIVGVGRSGTSSLLQGIGSQGFYKIGEPFNYGAPHLKKWNWPLEELKIYNDVVVKFLVGQQPKEFNLDWMTFMIDFSKNFNHVILLDRKNFDEHLLSISNLWWKIKNNDDLFSSWVSTDVPKNFFNHYTKNIGIESLKKEKKLLQSLSSVLNIDTTYYEDLYGHDREKSLELIKSWNIKQIDSNILNDYLDPKHKLKKIITII